MPNPVMLSSGGQVSSQESIQFLGALLCCQCIYFKLWTTLPKLDDYWVLAAVLAKWPVKQEVVKMYLLAVTVGYLPQFWQLSQSPFSSL